MPSSTIDNEVFLQPTQVQLIAIIGGGASGSIALDSLLKETPSNFKKITVYERRNILGGVWALDSKLTNPPHDLIKCDKTNLELDPQLANPFNSGARNLNKFLITPSSSQERFEETPSYQGIKTNIIEQMMTFSDQKKWPAPENEDTKYVDGLKVQAYIENYFSRNLDDERVQLVQSTTVEDVEKVTRVNSLTNEIGYHYRLTLRQKLNEKQDIWWQEDYDSIVIATGHYHVPKIPHVEGLTNIQKIPDVIHHAKFFRDAEPYRNKVVIIIGSRASGSDLVKFLSEAATTVYHSKRSSYNLGDSQKPNVITKPVITKYELTKDGFKVWFEDGTTVENPDHIIYATGYSFSYPYLNRLTNNELVIQGTVVNNLYQHTFLINEPLIAFVGVPVDAISFRAFEYQAILVSRYLAGKIKLPSRLQQLEWVSNRLEEKGITRAYHTIGVLEALNFLDTLTQLGKIENEKIDLGRKFPIVTENDVAQYRSAGETLRKFWDEPR